MAYHYTQPEMTFANGTAWDGACYLSMAEQVASHDVIHTSKPFVYRVGMPWLAGTLFPRNPFAGFKIMNALIGLILIPLLWCYLRHFLQHKTALLITVFIFVSNPLNPLRFSAFFPVYIDPLAMALSLLLLTFLIRINVWSWRIMLALSLMCFFAVLVRETLLLVPLAGFCALHIQPGNVVPTIKPNLSKTSLRAALPFLLALTGIWLTHQWVEPGGANFMKGYTFSAHAMKSITYKIENPLAYVIPPFLAFGPALLLVLLRPRTSWNFLSRTPILTIFLLGILTLGFIGGMHTVRFMYWGFPVFLPLIGLAIEDMLKNKSRTTAFAILGLVVVTQCIAVRAGTTIPDLHNPKQVEDPAFFFLAPYGDHAHYLQMWAWYMSDHLRKLYAVQMTGIAGLLLLITLAGHLRRRPTLSSSQK